MMNANDMDVAELRLAVQELRRYPAEVARLEAKVKRLQDAMRLHNRSFCTHCHKLFPKGKAGLLEFQSHIAKCNAHPLHPLRLEVERLQRYPDAIADVRARYPEDVFPDSNVAARMARLTCDNIEREAAEAEEG